MKKGAVTRKNRSGDFGVIPPLKKDLDSSSSSSYQKSSNKRQIRTSRSLKMNKGSKKDMKKTVKYMLGGDDVDMNGKSIYIGVKVLGSGNNVSFEMDKLITPRYKNESNDSNRDFEILFGNGANVENLDIQLKKFDTTINPFDFKIGLNTLTNIGQNEAITAESVRSSLQGNELINFKRYWSARTGTGKGNGKNSGKSSVIGSVVTSI
jgi:hypothetical protein